MTWRDFIYFFVGSITASIGAATSVTCRTSTSSPPPAVDNYKSEPPSSSVKPMPKVVLDDITVEGRRDPVSTTCFNVTTCDCALDLQTCHDNQQDRDYICSNGLVFLKEEYLLWGDKLFRDVYHEDCRPPGQPKLKLCAIGASCAYQSLKEQELCLSADNRLSACLCGVVFDFSKPLLRITLASLGCTGQPACEPPPDPPVDL